MEQQNSGHFLLNIYFNHLKGRIFIINMLVSAHPHFDIGGGGLWQLLVEPRRRVEGAAGVSRSTTSTIPQRVLAVESVQLECVCASCVAEIVVPHEGRDNGLAILLGVDTGAYDCCCRINLIERSCKGPDVLSWGPICETDTVQVVSIDTWIISSCKSIRRANLIGLDSSAYSRILNRIAV